MSGPEDRSVKARAFLESGAYLPAAEAFMAAGEFASAARAFVCAKEYPRAAECFERAHKPLDAARRYMLLKKWDRAALLFERAGDAVRAQLARQQATLGPALPGAGTSPKAPPAAGTWPPGDLWRSLAAGDTQGAVQVYTRSGGPSGWTLLGEASGTAPLKALAEMLFTARDYALAAEAFRRLEDDPRAAQCLSLAGLHGEAADLYARCGQRLLAAQHLEKAHAWDHAAALYRDEGRFLDAARCHEKDDEPVKAAGMYLREKKPDLALPLLQAVPPAHRAFAQCRLLAGKILFQKGEREVALSLLGPLLQHEAKGDEAFETLYQVALLLEQAGEAERARGVYLGLQKARFGYKDVSARLEKLAQVPPPPKPSSPPAAGREAGPAAPDVTPLRDCTLFNRLDLEELRRLLSVGRELRCAPGQVVLRGGQASEGLFVVLEGGLTITPNPERSDVAVGFLGPGDFVGLGSLVQGPPQPNALVATAGTRLLSLSAQTLEALTSSQPELGMKLFRSVAEHLCQTLVAESQRNDKK